MGGFEGLAWLHWFALISSNFLFSVLWGVEIFEFFGYDIVRQSRLRYFVRSKE